MAAKKKSAAQKKKASAKTARKAVSKKTGSVKKSKSSPALTSAGPVEPQMDRKEVAHVLDEIGTLLELHGENPFKTRAYHNAARTLQSTDLDLPALIESKSLTDIKGVGQALAEKITELVTTGELRFYKDLLDDTPPGLVEMLKIPSLGPKKVKHLYDDLGIESIRELEYACNENRLVDLPGFGATSQKKVLDGIDQLKRFAGRHRVDEALEIAHVILEALEGHRAVKRIALAGSLRRFKEVVKDADVLVATNDQKKVMKAFVEFPDVEHVIAHGETKSSIILGGLQIDLRAVSDEQFPYALHHFTGSREHNTAMRGLAKSHGMKMNEYGLFKGPKDTLVTCATEEDIFAALGLAYIPPEMREDMGEIQAAADDALPELLTEDDIRGSLHNHTTYSDGSQSVEEMAKAAQQHGHSFIAITDHSQTAVYAHGLEPARIKKQHQEIDALNKKFKNFRILKGIESDILADGSLDYPASVLKSFDVVVASVHSGFKQSKDKQTKRVITAIENPHTTLIGHPTGRLLLAREGFEVDMDAVFKAAAKNNVAIELNAHPSRLDLDWRLLKKATGMGVTISINPDAHSIDGFDDIRYGVGIARKGWLTKKDVLNTRAADAILR